MTAVVDSKLCRKCGETKLFAEFFRNNTASDGLQSYCKPCMNADKMRRYREKHPPQIKPPIPTHKVCNRCGLDKQLTEFSPAKAARDKHRATCKVCTRAERKAAYRIAHPPAPPKPPATEKLCHGCGSEKPLSEFHKAARKGLGVASRCKSCCTAYQKTYNSIQSLVRAAPSEKCCPRCNVTKPASEFHPNASRKDQLSVYCQLCQHEYVKAKQYDKKRYEEMREEELERGRVYRAANVEKVREVSRESRKKNRHKYAGRIRVKNVERKLRVKGATPLWANKAAMAAIYDEARRLEREDGRKRHVDHIVPLNGKNVCGLHVETNMQILFEKENLIKQNKFEVQ
jgi:hypothetical protein